MQRKITKKGLDNNIGNLVFHTTKGEYSTVLGTLMHSSNLKCQEVKDFIDHKNKEIARKIYPGDIVQPRQNGSAFNEYVVDVTNTRDSYYLMVHCTNDLRYSVN